MVKQIDLFISSTCYDLVDLRRELQDYFTREVFGVRISEDAQSGFVVDPNEDSIASCLSNVESSDAVIVVLDRRYGGLLPSSCGEYAGISATHAEVRHAQKKKKPIFYFIREEALADYQRMRRDPKTKRFWVEPDNDARAELWFRFVDSLFQLPEHRDLSNWYDPFKSSVDLKRLAMRRLILHFPNAQTLAKHPDRLVRLTFHLKTSGPFDVAGYFENVGVGPAMNINHGFRNSDKAILWSSTGGLSERGQIVQPGRDCFSYVLTGANREEVSPSLYCEYENRFGDRYLTLVPLKEDGAGPLCIVKPEEFYAWQGDATGGQWVRIA